jgi:amphi-Trp domain-containing protein
MSRESDRLEYLATIAAEDAAAYLESIAEGLRKHALRVDAGSQSVAMAVAPKMDVALDVRAEPRKSSIQILLSWRSASATPRPGLSILTPNGSSERSERHKSSAPSANGANPRRTRKAAIKRSGGAAKKRTRRADSGGA